MKHEEHKFHHEQLFHVQSACPFKCVLFVDVDN